MNKIFIILILAFLMLTSCTRDFGIKITKPGADLILSKMQSGNWKDATANGNELTIGSDKYTFDSPVLAIGGVYKDSNGNYIMAAPAGDKLYVVNMNSDAKKAVDTILDILDDAGGQAVVGNLISAIIDNGSNINLSDSDKILAGTNLTPEKRAEVEAILKASSSGFTGGKVIN